MDENETEELDKFAPSQITPKARSGKRPSLTAASAFIDKDLETDNNYTVDYYDEEFNEYENQFEASPTHIVDHGDDDAESGLSELSNEVLYFSNKV